MSFPPDDTGGTDVVMVAHALVAALVTHGDADVTVVIGDTLVDICGVSLDSDREKFVLRVLAEDLTDAMRKLASDGWATQVTDDAAGDFASGS